MVNHEVRQVLMNELGLTREVVRHEMTLIIEEVVARKFNEDWLRQFEDRIVNRVLCSRGSADIHKLIQQATDAAVKQAANSFAAEIMNSINVKVTAKEVK